MLSATVLGLTYHRIILESVTPDLTQSLKEDYDYSFIVSMGQFSDQEYSVVKKKSCLLNLTKGLDSVINRFNSTCRNEFRRTERNSDLTFFQGYADFNEYYSFYTQCEKDRAWFPTPPEELRNSFLFTASFKNELISGMSCYAHGSRLRVGRIYSNKRSKLSESLNNTVYGSAAKRIVVEICKFGIANGYQTVDLGGVDLSGQKSGITQFKLSLGGELVDVFLGRHMKETFTSRLNDINKLGWDIT